MGESHSRNTVSIQNQQAQRLAMEVSASFGTWGVERIRMRTELWCKSKEDCCRQAYSPYN